MKTLLLAAGMAVSLGSATLHAQTEPAEPTSVTPAKAEAVATPAPSSAPATGPAKGESCSDCMDCHGDEGAALRKLEQEWADAIAKHDVDAIGRIEADEFICTDPSGAVTHRADDLEMAKVGALKLTDVKIEDTKVSVYGETAVVTGKSTFTGTAYDQPIGGSYRWTDVFVKREGRWQVVASQATTIVPAAGAAAGKDGE